MLVYVPADLKKRYIREFIAEIAVGKSEIVISVSKCTDRRHPHGLGAEGQGRAIRLAVIEEMPLEALNHGLGNLLRVFQPAMIGPDNEVTQDARASINRMAGVIALQLPDREAP